MQIKTTFQQKIEGCECELAVFRLKKLSVHALPGLCTLNIFEYEISLSCGKFRNHHREPLFGHGNTFDRGRPVYIYTIIHIITNTIVCCSTVKRFYTFKSKFLFYKNCGMYCFQQYII